MRYILLAGLVALASAAPAFEKRHQGEDPLAALTGAGAAPAAGATPAANNAAAANADPLAGLLGGAGGAGLAGILRKRQLEELTGLLGGDITGGAASGQKAAADDPLAGLLGRRQLEQLTALLGGAAPAKDAQGKAKQNDPLAGLGALLGKRAPIEDDDDNMKKRSPIEDDDDDMKKRAFIPAAQPTAQLGGQPQGQQIGSAGPTSDINTILGQLSAGGPSGSQSQGVSIGAALANDPQLSGQGQGQVPGGITAGQALPNGQTNGQAGLGGQSIQPSQPQGGAGVTVALADPNVNRIGQPALISNGPNDLGGFAQSGVLPQ